MPPTAPPSASDPQHPDPSTFLEQQAAILLDAPDNDTMVRRLLAAALQRISALEQQLAAATPPARPRPPSSLRPPILTLLREQPEGLTRSQIEVALAQRGLGDTLRRMVRDAMLVRIADRYRLAPAAPEGPAPAEATPPAPPASSPTPAPRKRGGRPRTRGQA